MPLTRLCRDVCGYCTFARPPRGGKPYLSIDEVLDLVEVRPAELKPGPPPAGIDPRLIRAHGRHAGRAFAVMDTEALLAPVLG